MISQDPFYKVILEAMIKDTEVSLRMFEPFDQCFEDIAAIKSSLRRAITDAKEAIRGYEE
jgi:hypothetical protein